MRKLLVMMSLFLLSGCGGVIMNAQYSGLLDRTAALAAETAARADAGKLSPAEMTAALDAQARTWALFQDARDGKDSSAMAGTQGTAVACAACSAPVPMVAGATTPTTATQPDGGGK